jgi:hypothetical protein
MFVSIDANNEPAQEVMRISHTASKGRCTVDGSSEAFRAAAFTQVFNNATQFPAAGQVDAGFLNGYRVIYKPVVWCFTNNYNRFNIYASSNNHRCKRFVAALHTFANDIGGA